MASNHRDGNLARFLASPPPEVLSGSAAPSGSFFDMRVRAILTRVILREQLR